MKIEFTLRNSTSLTSESKLTLVNVIESLGEEVMLEINTGEDQLCIFVLAKDLKFAIDTVLNA